MVFFSFLLGFLCSANAWGQADIAEQLGYPDYIVYNSKVVTMDDASFESTVGTIVSAMAVRGQ